MHALKGRPHRPAEVGSDKICIDKAGSLRAWLGWLIPVLQAQLCTDSDRGRADQPKAALNSTVLTKQGRCAPGWGG